MAAPRARCPGALVVVADDGSRDATRDRGRGAGALVIRLPRRGKGQALTLAEREAPPGPLLLCDADLEGDLDPLLRAGGDIAIAVFPTRRGNGFGLAKGVARAAAPPRSSGFEAREPLSGQRRLSERAREECFPLAAGFGCEVGMTVDAVAAGLEVIEVEAPLAHRETGRDLAGFRHRGRQLAELVLALGPQGVNHRGLRLPLVGWTARSPPGRLPSPSPPWASSTTLRSGAERGCPRASSCRADDRVLKLVAIPAVGLVATRKLSGALLVGLAANALNQLDTKPGRALKAYLLARGPGRCAARSRRRPPSLRSSRDGDARRRGGEHAGRAARLEVRG